MGHGNSEHILCPDAFLHCFEYIFQDGMCRVRLYTHAHTRKYFLYWCSIISGCSVWMLTDRLLGNHRVKTRTIQKAAFYEDRRIPWIYGRHRFWWVVGIFLQVFSGLNLSLFCWFVFFLNPIPSVAQAVESIPRSSIKVLISLWCVVELSHPPCVLISISPSNEDLVWLTRRSLRLLTQRTYLTPWFHPNTPGFVMLQHLCPRTFSTIPRQCC